MSEVILRVYLVRHGETNEKKQNIVQGQMDTVLNENGHHQARLCGEALKGIDFAHVFSSDLKRALETTNAIMAHHPNVVDANESLRERHLGEAQGLEYDVYDRNRAQLMQSAESRDMFRQRTKSWWTNNITPNLQYIPGKSEPQNILAVSHSGYIKDLCQMLVDSKKIEAPADYNCPCASVTRIDFGKDGGGRLVNYADISHLERV